MFSSSMCIIPFITMDLLINLVFILWVVHKLDLILSFSKWLSITLENSQTWMPLWGLGRLASSIFYRFILVTISKSEVVLLILSSVIIALFIY